MVGLIKDLVDTGKGLIKKKIKAKKREAKKKFVSKAVNKMTYNSTNKK